MTDAQYEKTLLHWRTLSFSAVLLIICLLIAYFLPDNSFTGEAKATTHAVAEPVLPQFYFASQDFSDEYRITLKKAALQHTKKQDTALMLYRTAESRPAVEWFYTRITENNKIATVILEYADKNDIPPSLAFALAYIESGYKTTAVNRNTNGTIDRGLFQLNSASFPRLSEEEFFDPAISAQYGLSHLRFCFTSGGNDIAALAMYNAGTARIKNDGTPRRTLNYISNILNYKEALDSLFDEEIAGVFHGFNSLKLASAK
jgi:soluble lytic murein transglycosylase-like protein